MKRYRLETFTRGWIVGDFVNSIIKTKEFEVAVMMCQKGDIDKKHVHYQADEIMIIVSGSFVRNGELFGPGDVHYIAKGESLESKCLQGGTIVVIKTPSVPEDKHYIG